MTQREKSFAAVYATTGDSRYSAEKAGYSSPAQRGSGALQKPAIQAEIARVQRERLFSEALPAAVKCLIDIVTDSKAAAGARVQASKVILDRTLGQDDNGEVKEPHEMTADELSRAITRLEQVAAERAKPVIQGESAPIAQPAPKATDIFE